VVNMHPKTDSPRTLLLALLLAAGGIQAGLVLTNYGTQWFKAAWRTRSLSAMDRNARFLLGQTGMEYMRFLLRAIPARSTVVVPDAAGPFPPRTTFSSSSCRDESWPALAPAPSPPGGRMSAPNACGVRGWPCLPSTISLLPR